MFEHPRTHPMNTSPEFLSDNNYYIFLKHNCNTIAREEWDLISDDEICKKLNTKPCQTYSKMI